MILIYLLTLARIEDRYSLEDDQKIPSEDTD